MFPSSFQWLRLLAAAAVGLAGVPPHSRTCRDARWSVEKNNAGFREHLVMSECDGFQLEEATIGLMQEALEAGRLTSVQLVNCYLKRTFQTKPYLKLRKLTPAGPTSPGPQSSVMQEIPDVMDIAIKLDEERRANKTRGPLHGIPFTIKDNIATDDLMETTAGSWALLGSRPYRDATIVTRLREAGAILLGKAAMSEWADMRSSNYSEGYSPRGGQCRSAYNLTVNPGGSSSGSAVGVAAKCHGFFHRHRDGWQQRNQIVGFKPTVGLTSRAGVIPESENQDSVGTLGRTVRDAVLALDAIHGADELDPRTVENWNEHQMPRGGFEKLLSGANILAGARFGVPKSLLSYTDEETRNVLLKVFDLLKEHGANVIETDIESHELLVSPTGWDWDFNNKGNGAKRSEYTYVKVDFYNNINDYLKELRVSPMRSLEDIVNYNKRYHGTEGGFPRSHPAFYSGQDGLEASVATHGLKDTNYDNALESRRKLARDGVNAALNPKAISPLDGLLVPLEPGQSYQVAAQAGYPLITLPAGVPQDSGMGIGLGIMQTAWRDGDLVKWASAIEDVMRCSAWRRTLPTWRGALERNLPVSL